MWIWQHRWHDKRPANSVYPHIREILLLKTNLTLAEAITIAVQVDSTSKVVKSMADEQHLPEHVVQTQNKAHRQRYSHQSFSARPANKVTTTSSESPCLRCGSEKHLANAHDCLQPAESAIKKDTLPAYASLSKLIQWMRLKFLNILFCLWRQQTLLTSYNVQQRYKWQRQLGQWHLLWTQVPQYLSYPDASRKSFSSGLVSVNPLPGWWHSHGPLSNNITSLRSNFGDLIFALHLHIENNDTVHIPPASPSPSSSTSQWTSPATLGYATHLVH